MVARGVSDRALRDHPGLNGEEVKRVPPKRSRKASAVGASGEAEADVELLHLMPAAAAANRNAVLTVEGVKLEVLAAEAAGRQLKLDEVRELPLSHVPRDLALAAAHAPRSSARIAGYDCSSDWTPLLAGLSPARMTASLAAPTPSS